MHGVPKTIHVTLVAPCTCCSLTRAGLSVANIELIFIEINEPSVQHAERERERATEGKKFRGMERGNEEGKRKEWRNMRNR